MIGFARLTRDAVRRLFRESVGAVVLVFLLSSCASDGLRSPRQLEGRVRELEEAVLELRTRLFFLEAHTAYYGEHFGTFEIVPPATVPTVR